MFRVGIPKEIKSLEKRVGLVPSAVKILCSQGVEVLVQEDAGKESGYPDQDYRAAGAHLVADARTLYAEADLIQKVKEPLAPEFSYFRKGLIIFGFLHLASPENKPLISALVRSEVTALGYETVEVNGKFPLLAPMSEIAGALAAAYGTVLKGKDPGDSILLSELEKAASQYPDFGKLSSPGNVVIFGGGVAGLKALETTLRLRGAAAVIEKNPSRRDFLKTLTPSVFSPEGIPETLLEQADVLIGSVHARGSRAVHVLDEKQLEQISRVKSKVIIDIAIDQGGNFPGSRPTAYLKPVYRDSESNLRFCVPNIPSLCGRGASESLSHVTLPYTQALAQNKTQAFKMFPELEAALNIDQGVIKIPVIRESYENSGA